MQINVNVYVYSLVSHRVQQTSQFTPLVLELSFIRSHLWEELSTFSAIHNSRSTRVPSLLGGQTRHMKGLPNTSTHSVPPALVTHPTSNRAQRCLTSVI